MSIMHELLCHIQKYCLIMLNKQALMGGKLLIRAQIKV